MTKIVLIRHGHVEGISPARFRGRADVPLTEQGIAEARAAARRIAEGWSPAKVYTSPLQRCVTTGSFIADACGCSLEPLQDLNDIDYGALQWKTHDEVKREHPDLFKNWFSTPHLVRFPQGDSLQDLVVRTSNALRLTLDRHTGETVVLVGHDNVNRALLLQLLDQPLSAYWRVAQSPCAINEIDIADGTVRIMRINDTGHLPSH
jgi:broad specificity phosphatase PhoE